MKIYEKYILNLLITRFVIILLFVSVFGVFQEVAKGDIFKFCSFWQSMMILPITLPFLLFQFLPFIYFGTLILILNELYLKNELLSLKAIGLSNRKIIKIVFYFAGIVLLFFLCLGLLYPMTNRLFVKSKNNFQAINVLKVLHPKTINEVGNYVFFFDDIDNHNVMHNVSIITKNKKNIFHKNNGKKIIFSKSVNFGYNEFNELTARCVDNDVLTLRHNKTNALYTEQTIHSDNMDVFVDDFFTLKQTSELRYKQRLRQTGFFDLLKKNTHHDVQRKTEIYGRMVVYWFVLLTITAVCCLLLTRRTSRFSEKKTVAVVIILGSICCAWKPFFLEGVVSAGLEFIDLACFMVIFMFCCLFAMRR